MIESSVCYNNTLWTLGGATVSRTHRLLEMHNCITSQYRGQSGRSITNELTDWSVDLDGFTSCLEDIIHASRWRMNCLLIGSL